MTSHGGQYDRPHSPRSSGPRYLSKVTGLFKRSEKHAIPEGSITKPRTSSASVVSGTPPPRIPHHTRPTPKSSATVNADIHIESPSNRQHPSEPRHSNADDADNLTPIMARITLDFKAGPMTPRRHTADRAIIDSNLYPTPPSSPPVSRTLGRNVPPRRHYQFPESPMTPGNSPYRDVNGNRNAIDYPNDPFYSTPSPPRVSAYSPSQSVRKPSPSRAHLSRFQVYGLWSDSDMEEVRKREGRKEGKPGNGQGYLFYVVVRGRRPGVYRTWKEANDQIIDLEHDAVHRSYTTKGKAEAAFEKAQSLGVVRVLRDE